jgi:hypothetical protein
VRAQQYALRRKTPAPSPCPRPLRAPHNQRPFSQECAPCHAPAKPGLRRDPAIQSARPMGSGSGLRPHAASAHLSLTTWTLKKFVEFVEEDEKVNNDHYLLFFHQKFYFGGIFTFYKKSSIHPPLINHV